MCETSTQHSQLNEVQGDFIHEFTDSSVAKKQKGEGKTKNHNHFFHQKPTSVLTTTFACHGIPCNTLDFNKQAEITLHIYPE